TCGQAVGIWLIEHMVLGRIRGFRFPFGVVGNLSALGTCFIQYHSTSSALIDVRRSWGSPVASEIRLTVCSTHHRAGRNRRSSATTTATGAGTTSATARRAGRSTGSATLRCLSQEALCHDHGKCDACYDRH